MTELELTAEHYRSSLIGLVAMTLEKARAYRACVADIRKIKAGRETVAAQRATATTDAPTRGAMAQPPDDKSSEALNL